MTEASDQKRFFFCDFVDARLIKATVSGADEDLDLNFLFYVYVEDKLKKSGGVSVKTDTEESALFRFGIETRAMFTFVHRVVMFGTKIC